MALIEFENYPSTDTAINANNLNNNFNELNTLISNIYNQIFPIGRGFLDFTDTDYSNYLGFTWERTLIGKVPVGIDSNDTDFNTIGKTDGEKTHTLTSNEIPQTNIWAGNTQAYMRHNVYSSGSSLNGVGSWGSSSDVAIQTTGGGQAHNNLQPYEVVAFWKRIA